MCTRVRALALVFQGLESLFYSMTGGKGKNNDSDGKREGDWHAAAVPVPAATL